MARSREIELLAADGGVDAKAGGDLVPWRAVGELFFELFPALGEPESDEVAEEVFVEDWQFMGVAWLQGDDGGVDGWAWVERVGRHVAHDGRLPSGLQAHGQLAVVA